MSKATAPKLRIPLLDTIKLCRPKRASSMVVTSLPRPVSTTLDDYLSLLITSRSHPFSIPTFPDPPCTPDNNPRTKHNLSKIVPHGHIGGPSNHVGMETQSLLDHECYSRMRKSGKGGDVSSRIEKKGEKPGGIKLNEDGPRVKQTERGMKPRKLRDRAITKSMMDKEVNEESFVVVKRSEDPYEDFKKSMVEMIVEKGMVEPWELENLLMKFLSINSRMHHRAILQAFTEIFKELFT